MKAPVAGHSSCPHFLCVFFNLPQLEGSSLKGGPVSRAERNRKSQRLRKRGGGSWNYRDVSVSEGLVTCVASGDCGMCV